MSEAVLKAMAPLYVALIKRNATSIDKVPPNVRPYVVALLEAEQA